jgi:hypothetical protein
MISSKILDYIEEEIRGDYSNVNRVEYYPDYPDGSEYLFQITKVTQMGISNYYKSYSNDDIKLISRKLFLNGLV